MDKTAKAVKWTVPGLLAGLALLAPASYSPEEGVTLNTATCADVTCCWEMGAVCNGMKHMGIPQSNHYEEEEWECEQPEEE